MHQTHPYRFALTLDSVFGQIQTSRTMRIQFIAMTVVAGAVFLAVIAVLPNFVTANTTLPPAMAYFLGGTSVLIVVGVAMDLVDRLNAQLVMRNYEGFMKSSAGPGAGWARRT